MPEGGSKATLDFDEVDEPVRKIASFLPVSDELLSETAIYAWCPISGLFNHYYAAKPAFRALTLFTGGS